jgi:L-threonylcarbamoyladenylate synthase
MPRHPIALELIRATGLPLAAPSANKFTQVSPTTAGHVHAAFGDDVPVIDGGPCEVGIESTVVSVDEHGVVRLLRPGMIQVEDAIPVTMPAGGNEAHASPGMHRKHYSPRQARVMLTLQPPANAAWLWHSIEDPEAAVAVQMPADPQQYAAKIYAVLHDLDARGVQVIAIEPLPEGVAWDALRDRLKRSAFSDEDDQFR